MSNNRQVPPPKKLPVDYDELFPGRFLKAGLFRARPVTLQIRAVYTEPLPQDNGQDRVRGVLAFEKTPLELVLNRTNGACIKAMFGPQVQGWVGKRVTFACEQDRFGAQVVDAIRVQGSPDIDRPISITIQLPHRRPLVRQLIPTGNGQPPPVDAETAE